MSASAEAIEWLLTDRSATTVADLLGGLAALLTEQGLPIWRLGTSQLTSHPEVFTETVNWTRGEPVESFPVPHEIARNRDRSVTPIVQAWETRKPVRCRLEVPLEEIPWSALRDLREAGATDYLIMPIPLGGGRQSYLSASTDRPGGFTEADVTTLGEVRAAFGLRLEALCEAAGKRGLLEVYLGKNAAARVLAGDFDRGSGAVIQAAIWYCDLRGFTTLADRRPVVEVVRVLDQYFERVADAVDAQGGEILKFIGDAVLAIFPVGPAGPADPCRRALVAAEAALDAIDQLAHDSGEAGLHIGVALHLGEVMFGNIGGRARLDFTVIGKAVNEVCRVEPLCKQLHTALLFTTAFRQAIPDTQVVSVGKFELRGVSEPQEIFTSLR